MKLFRPIYEKALQWARHRHAERILACLSFVEAFFFPVMPEVMLAPMTLAQPQRWLRLASLSLVFSLAGAVVGYALGHYAFDALRPLLASLGWLPRIDALVAQLRADVAQSPWTAFWLLVLAGFTPVPLKIFTWASGIVGVPMPAFLASMLVGRGKRVYLLCGLIRVGGARAEAALHRWIEWVGWAAVALLLGLAAWFHWR